MAETDNTLSRQNLEMITIADEFCKLIENNENYSKQYFLETLQHFAPLLYLRGSLLKPNEPEYAEAAERFVTEEQWDAIFLSLRDFFQSDDEFLYAGLSEFGDDSLLNASISEHLADVYQDLKDFVILFKRQSLAARENALYECKQLFDERWGNRLATLLPVIHRLCGNSNSHNNSTADPYPHF